MSAFASSDLTGSLDGDKYANLSCFEGLLDSQNLLVSNASYFSYFDKDSNGSTIEVLSLTGTGRRMPQKLIPNAHKGIVKDIAFNPFDANVLLSCSTDNILRAWRLSSMGTNAQLAVTPALTVTNSTSSGMRGISFNPVIANLAVVRGSRQLYLYDITASTPTSGAKLGTELTVTAESTFGGDMQSMAWSSDGKLVISQSKDKQCRLFDMRTATSCVASIDDHTGIRYKRILSNPTGVESPYVLTFGHESNFRNVNLIDMRTMSIVSTSLVSTGSTPLLPLGYDPDAGLAALLHKEEDTMMVYRVDVNNTEHPLTECLNIPLAKGSKTHAVSMLPKQCCNTQEQEVCKLLTMTSNSVESVSIKANSETPFESLYPPSSWGITPAALNLSEWRNSTADYALPSKVAIEPSSNLESSTASKSAGSSLKVSVTKSLTEGVGRSSTTDNRSIDDILAEKAERVSLVRERMSMTSTASRFRHMSQIESKPEHHYLDLDKRSYNGCLSESTVVTASDTYWALPWAGGGGPVLVWAMDGYGKVAPEGSVLNGHTSAVADVEFSPFVDNWLASTGGDGKVNVWQLPEHPSQLSTHVNSNTAPMASFDLGAPGRCINWHPTVKEMVVNSNVANEVSMLDVTTSSTVTTMTFRGERNCVNNVAFNFDGSLLAVGCKDDSIKVLDPRIRGESLRTSADTTIGRNLHVDWVYDPYSFDSDTGSVFSGRNSRDSSCILSVSSVKGNRMIQIWDIRNIDTPVHTSIIDNGSGQLYPMWDYSLGVCFIFGKGDTIVRAYDINTSDLLSSDSTSMKSSPSTKSSGSIVTCSKACEFRPSGMGTASALAGMGILPKKSIDVRSVECLRVLKLNSNDVMVPTTYKVPKAAHLKPYFADDIYNPIRTYDPAQAVSLSTYQSYLCSPSDSDVYDTILPKSMDMCPTDMTRSSQRPQEETVKKSSSDVFLKQKLEAEREQQLKDDNFARLSALATNYAAHNQNYSMGNKDEVDSDDNWDD